MASTRMCAVPLSRPGELAVTTTSPAVSVVCMLIAATPEIVVKKQDPSRAEYLRTTRVYFCQVALVLKLRNTGKARYRLEGRRTVLELRIRKLGFVFHACFGEILLSNETSC